MKGHYLTRTAAIDFLRARGLQLTERSLRRWSIEHRRIPYSVFGGKQYFTPEGLEKWLKSEMEKPSNVREPASLDQA